MEVDSLSDGDLRKLLMEHGVNSPVTDSTRNVLRNKLSKVISSQSQNTVYREQRSNNTVEELDSTMSELISEPIGQVEQNDSYTVEEVVNTSSCIVTDGDCNTSQEYIQKIHTEVHTPARYEQTHDEDLMKYEYTPTTNSLRYARGHYPSDSDLRRRPLNTPKVGIEEHTSSKIEKKTRVSSSSEPKSSSWSRWLCNRFLLLFLLLVVLCIVLVYYHMDENLLPSIREGKPTPKPAKEARS